MQILGLIVKEDLITLVISIDTDCPYTRKTYNVCVGKTYVGLELSVTTPPKFIAPTIKYCVISPVENGKITHEDLVFKNMTDELACSVAEIDVYFNMYLHLTNQIPEQELRNNISKLFQ